MLGGTVQRMFHACVRARVMCGTETRCTYSSLRCLCSVTRENALQLLIVFGQHYERDPEHVGGRGATGGREGRWRGKGR